MKVKQEFVDDFETKPEAQLGGKVKAGCDHHKLRDGIDEHGVLEFSQPPLIASEALSSSSPIHSPDFLDSTAEDYDNSALPEEMKPDHIAEKGQEAVQMAENRGGVKTVDTSKLVEAFAQSTVESPVCKIQRVETRHTFTSRNLRGH